MSFPPSFVSPPRVCYAHCLEAKARGDTQRARCSQIIAWGDGSPTREFLYVEDAAEGILLATERLNLRLPVNLGSSVEKRIKELLETIARLTGFAGPHLRGAQDWDTSKPNGQPRRKLDTSRAKRLAGGGADSF